MTRQMHQIKRNNKEFMKKIDESGKANATNNTELMKKIDESDKTNAPNNKE